MTDETVAPTPQRACDGCHGFGGNWDCMGEGGPDCLCENCTGQGGIVSGYREIVRESYDQKPVVGVGDHQPVWADVDCPSCGSAPCGPHPDVLVCHECSDDWSVCTGMRAAVAELRRMAAAEDGPWWAIATSLAARADELERGVAAPAVDDLPGMWEQADLTGGETAQTEET